MNANENNRLAPTTRPLGGATGRSPFGAGWVASVAMTAALAGMPSPARADPELPPPRAARGPDDGVWFQATAVLPVGEDAVAVQYGDIGGNRIRYVAVQGEHRLDPHWSLGAAYGFGVLRLDGRRDPRLHLFRALATWTNGGRRWEVDARAWADYIVTAPGTDSQLLRTRLRVSGPPLPGSGISIRPFVADEVYLVRGAGFTRNRWTVGLRTRPTARLGVDIGYQRTDDRGGAGQNVLLIQTTLLLRKP